MNLGSFPLAGGMISNLNKLDKIANNMANINTNGFKENNLVNNSFNNYLKTNKQEGNEINNDLVTMNTIPKVGDSFFDSKIGNIVNTNNELDFAINQNNAFFKLEDNNGNMLLTRDGSFKIENNLLISQEGFKVLSSSGDYISTNNPNFKNEIGLIESDFSNLKNFGNNNYIVLNNENISEVENTNEKILKSSLEKSNVNIMKSMVDIITAQRSYEQMQKGLHSINELDQESLKIGTTKA